VIEETRSRSGQRRKRGRIQRHRGRETGEARFCYRVRTRGGRLGRSSWHCRVQFTSVGGRRGKGGGRGRTIRTILHSCLLRRRSRLPRTQCGTPGREPPRCDSTIHHQCHSIRGEQGGTHLSRPEARFYGSLEVERIVTLENKVALTTSSSVLLLGVEHGTHLGEVPSKHTRSSRPTRPRL
jgi:hypothetical protein